MIAQLIHQIEYLFSWNDALPNDVELTFVVSAFDQCKFGFFSRLSMIKSIFSFYSR